MSTHGWRSLVLTTVLTAIVTACAAPGRAEGPSISLIPFKRVEADPNKDYEVTEDNGPWMILATSFAGEGAEKQARQLVLELRRDFKLPAYTHKKHFDFTQPVEGLGVNKFGETRKMKHATSLSFDEIAVLVGNFPAVDDSGLQKALQKLKYANPTCLDIKKAKGATAQRNGKLRYLYRLVSNDDEQKAKGPMGNAFATRNPLLPPDDSDSGLDPLVVKMNKGVEHSLLKNPAKYSVKVATFGGISTWKKDEIEELERSGRSKLEEAAYKANKLTDALRAQGVEAYEFHDLHESIVCVGSFASVGEPRADGRIEINPAVHAIIKKYGAEQKMLNGQSIGLQPKKLGGIHFDVTPVPIEIPKASLGAAYSRRVME